MPITHSRRVGLSSHRVTDIIACQLPTTATRLCGPLATRSICETRDEMHVTPYLHPPVASRATPLGAYNSTVPALSEPPTC